LWKHQQKSSKQHLSAHPMMEINAAIQNAWWLSAAPFLEVFRAAFSCSFSAMLALYCCLGTFKSQRKRQWIAWETL